MYSLSDDIFTLGAKYGVTVDRGYAACEPGHEYGYGKGVLQ